MRQLLQDLKKGMVKVVDMPTPKCSSADIQIAAFQSLVSAGTERMLLEFGKAGWIGRARQQPDKVRLVLEKVHTDGMAATIETVKSKLDQPLVLGYCNVGQVIAIGEDVKGWSVGDRVVSNGAHAEIVSVPKNLCARIPNCVTDEEAAFTVLGAIGLQGIRLASPTLGECVVVTGLGLIGLLTVQMLRAHGCRVLGIDYDAARVELARKFGADVVDLSKGEDPLVVAANFSRGRGVDAVLITAATKSNEPVRQAAKMCRKRGRIVLVGVTGLELSRADFYEKELSFQVSCSYGPGRYDPVYEEGGQDYPVGLVRWTEQRNFEAVLDLMASGQLDVEPLISHRLPLDRAGEAYDVLASDELSLGILLQYARRRNVDFSYTRTVALPATRTTASASNGVAFLGAGNYASRVLMPTFKAAGAELHTVVSGGGVSAVHHGRKQGFLNASTDSSATINNASVGAVVVATRHDSHARYVLEALRAGKHVFCEKPLCLTLEELTEIEVEASARSSQQLMVGFNRRFSPHVLKIKELLNAVSEAKSFVMTVNAGAIPADHWTQDSEVGGGRIVGEACHFIDLLRYLADSPIADFNATAIGKQSGSTHSDKVTIVLSFEDGSAGTIHYLANGHKGFPKERLEVFCAGRVLQLDNFRKLRGWGWKGFKKMSSWRQDKGVMACVTRFVNVVKEGGSPVIPINEIFEVSRISIEAAEAVR